jgi:AcrR family transcriptional regulator
LTQLVQHLSITGEEIMPKETFFNLPDDKRQAIIRIALEEFASGSFRSASISRIVDLAGIAKGSIYQYFENKRELYLYLISWAAETKMNAILQEIEGERGDFFRKYRSLLVAGSHFDLASPSAAQLLVRAMQEPAGSDPSSVSAALAAGVVDFFRPLVKEAMERRDIRSDVDPLFACHLCSTLTSTLRGYLEERYHFTIEELFLSRSRGEKELPFTEEQLQEAAERVTQFLRHGLG